MIVFHFGSIRHPSNGEIAGASKGMKRQPKKMVERYWAIRRGKNSIVLSKTRSLARRFAIKGVHRIVRVEVHEI